MKKIVLGNDFNLIIPVSRKVHTSTGDVIQDFNLLPACTDLQVNLVNFNETISLSCSVDVEHTSRLIANVDSSKLNIGNYALEVKGKIYGKAWRSNEYEQIAFVNNNASADEVFDGEIIEGESSVEVDHVFILLPPSADLTQLIDQASATIDKTNEALDKVTDAINKAETVDIDLNDTELEITRNSGEKKNFDLNRLKGEKGDGGKVQDVLVYGRSALVDNNTVNITNMGLLRYGTSYMTPYLSDNGQPLVNQDIGTDVDNVIAIGYQASAKGISLGSASSSTDKYSIAIGYHASASGLSTVLGYEAKAGEYGVAIGYGAKITSGYNYSIAIGYEANANGYESTAIGRGAFTYNYSVAIGRKAWSDERGVSIGNETRCGEYGVAIGYGAKNSGNNSIVIGNNLMTYRSIYTIGIDRVNVIDMCRDNKGLYLIGLGGYTGKNLEVNNNLNPNIKSVQDLIKEKVVKETVDFIADATTAEDVVTKFNQLLANLRSAGIMKSE